MIGQLTGRIVQRGAEELLLDVAGVGYEIRIPLSTFYALPDGDTEPVTLAIHTHVREDVLALFGFASTAERSTFRTLIAISGVGPRVALAILSGIGVDELRSAVQAQDRARLQKIPGVGRKTAERVLLELQDRLTALEPEPGPAGPERAGRGPGALSSVREDAVSALTNLGYPADRSRKAVEAVQEEATDSPTLESVLRAALARLSR